jgi:hypothetical protein
MMDFLRALAPQHAHARTRAVAALGSRFESDQPMRRVPPAVTAESQRDDLDAEPLLRADALPRIESVQHAGSETRAYDLFSARQLSPPEPGERDLSVTFPLSLPRRLNEPVIRERTVSGDAEPLSPIARPIRSQIATRASVVTPVAPIEEGRVDRTPLSQQAVAARMTPQSERPAVIHVTIDRIDVRAPASTDHRSKPHARSRTSPSSPSLADYLRARHSGRRGGSS